MSRLRSRLTNMDKKAELNENKLNSFIDKALNRELRSGNNEDLDDVKTFEIKSIGTITNDKNTVTTFEVKIIY